jgi:DNA-directed RNA polymerase specialized sigma24 family protein
MEPLTHAQQNRLIVDNMFMVEPIAALHRGQKGIPFDDLVAAARKSHTARQFIAFAYGSIENSIVDLIRNWEPFETVGLANAEGDKRYYEWALYRTPYEAWDQLAASPEELKIAFEELRNARNALQGAMIGLSKRDRAIVTARFLRNPPQKLESIAREHKISYARVVFLLDRALKRLKKVVQARIGLDAHLEYAEKWNNG